MECVCKYKAVFSNKYFTINEVNQLYCKNKIVSCALAAHG